MNFNNYIENFYKAIETHNRFFPREKLLGLETYKSISGQDISEREIDEISEYANRYIYEVIDACNRYEPIGYVCRCHFMAEIMRVYFLSLGYSAHDFSYTVGDVFFEEQSIYESSVDIVKGLIDEGPDSASDLKCHCWLTYKNKVIIDPSLQFHLNKKVGIPLVDNNFIYVLGEGYDSVSYTFEKGTEKKIGDILRYEPYLVDNDFYFRVENLSIAYAYLANKLDVDADTYGKMLASQKRINEKGISVRQKYFEAQSKGMPGRNDPCWCGSGIKFKKCHGKLFL